MGDNVNRRAVVNTYSVRADTLIEAVDKAIAMEKAWCEDMTESEGEEFTPSAPVSVLFMCELSKGPPGG